MACSGSHDGTETEACPAERIVPKLFFGAGREDYLALGARQQQAIGRVEPDLDGANMLACTGTVIAPGWVLTAAHCELAGATGLRFFIGANSRVPLASLHSRRTHRHPELDLLLMQIDEPFAEWGTLVDPIPISESFTPELGDSVELAGFGLTQDGTDGELRFLTESLVDADGTTLTVDGGARSGACTGDSGGPLLARDESGVVRVVGVLHAGSVECLGRDFYVPAGAANAFFRRHVGTSCPASSCGALTGQGRCFGTRAAWCERGVARGERCEDGKLCGWDATALGFRCVDPAAAACAGTDSFGRCAGAAVERCAGATREEDDCSARGAICAVDTSGHAHCF